jgi:hypothetical protein
MTDKGAPRARGFHKNSIEADRFLPKSIQRSSHSLVSYITPASIADHADAGPVPQS